MLRFFRGKSASGTGELETFLCRHALEIEGSLCVFGDRFGRGLDNWHKVTGYEVRKEYLKLTFKEGETLEVWRPRLLKKDGDVFLIQGAERVRWEWFYYGRPKLPENRYFREHVVKDGTVAATTNVTWLAPDFTPSLAEPAVALQ